MSFIAVITFSFNDTSLDDARAKAQGAAENLITTFAQLYGEDSNPHLDSVDVN